MSGSSSYNTYDSEDESTGWLMTSETSVDDELSDELTLLNGDEDCDEDTSSLEALIKLSMRLKKQYNLREATVQLERCDKIWDTMQLLKKMQMDNEVDDDQTADEDDEEDEKDETEQKYAPLEADSHLPEGENPSKLYIKYQPVQGNGNNALPNFYLAVKSQKKLYNCVTCGKQYSEQRSLRLHSQKEHGVVMPIASKKSRRSADIKPTSHESAENRTVNNSSSKDRDNSKSRLSSSSKHSTEQQSHRKHERKTTDSLFALPELKKEPETNCAKEDSREKPYICPVCNSAYSYQRSMNNHIINVHDMTLEEAGLAKPIAKKEVPQKVKEIKREKSQVKKEIVEGSTRPRYIYTCKPCGKTFPKKEYFRTHAKKSHKIDIPMQRNPPLSIDGDIRYYKHFKCEAIRNPADPPKPPRIRVNKEDDKTHVKSIDKDETQQPRTMRSGRRITDGPNVDRPRRACAANTSYTECTKEEEEVLQRELIFQNNMGESAKPSNSQTTPCFLCKKSFVDIRKHLVDYHRINCPETILPLATNAAESEKDSTSIASSETIETVSETTAEKKEKKEKPVKVKQPNVELNNEYIRMLRTKSSHSVWNPKRYQCVLCSYKFNRRSHVQRHLDKHTINGVVQMHTTEKRRKRSKVLKDPVVDPLALTDFAESSRNESQENSTDENVAETTGKKRINSSEDERLNSSFEHLHKRRKIETPEEFINIGSDSASESAQYNNERETVLVMAETDRRFDEEEKSGNPRDTRDSSDRDSGIGISITIKKRNNSYEVVEKDSGDDDKSKDFENSKDDNTCSDSSSDVTPAVFVNDGQEARRREILNSLDYSVEENVHQSVRDNFVVVDAFDKKREEESCSSDDKEANYCWKEGEHYGKEACASLPSNVPSLKVMCRTVLKKDDITNLNSHYTISHQCPVCYRFYPTERDVTVHMLEHKVSRTDFRATRILAIPSSALRRYGRRPV